MFMSEWGEWGERRCHGTHHGPRVQLEGQRGHETPGFLPKGGSLPSLIRVMASSFLPLLFPLSSNSDPGPAGDKTHQQQPGWGQSWFPTVTSSIRCGRRVLAAGSVATPGHRTPTALPEQLNWIKLEQRDGSIPGSALALWCAIASDVPAPSPRARPCRESPIGGVQGLRGQPCPGCDVTEVSPAAWGTLWGHPWGHLSPHGAVTLQLVSSPVMPGECPGPSRLHWALVSGNWCPLGQW